MAVPSSFLEEMLEGWRDARGGFIAEVLNIPARHFDSHPVPHMRSVREMCVHVLEVAMMMTGELTRPDTDFHRAPWPKLLAMYAGPAYRAKTRGELIALLRSQIKDGEKKFRATGEIALLQLFKRFDGSPGTRLAWFQHGIAQEEYHRGQLAVFARTLGLVPALTKMIQGG